MTQVSIANACARPAQSCEQSEIELEETPLARRRAKAEAGGGFTRQQSSCAMLIHRRIEVVMKLRGLLDRKCQSVTFVIVRPANPENGEQP